MFKLCGDQGRVPSQQKQARTSPKGSDIQALVQRLATLENSVRTTHCASSAATGSKVSNASTSPDVVATSERPLKRKRTESLINTATSTATSDADVTQQPVTEARTLISKELSTNSLLSGNQRSTLETAISFVDHLSHAPAPAITDRSTFDKSMYGSTELSQGEILHVILGSEARLNQPNTIDFHSLDHIPPKAVERIGLALMEGTADETTLLLYKVIIHFKAAVVLYVTNLRGPKSAEVQSHIRQMEYDHLAAALTALDSISFLNTPSLLLAQALITGSMMMQMMGNPASCWQLVAHASRTIVALGYHTITDTDPKTDVDEEIYAAVAWCAQFDSCMSLLLLRPKSLPPLNFRVSLLIKPDPANPMTIIENIAMEMVPVHDKLLELTLEANARRPVHSLGNEVAWLRSTMANILRIMENKRPSHLFDARPDILLHWKCIEFKYFSTLTSVHRLSPSVTTVPLEREECLKSARRALECIKIIEDIGKSLDHFIEGYDPYLAWTILSYPLCPFFVVFCNVVGTSNVQDFQLLQGVTDCISELVSENKFVNRLHRLCTTLITLCKPLVQERISSGQGNIVTYTDVSEAPLLPTDDTSLALGVPNVNGNADGFITSSWDDDMMWQLFQSQPSLDWFNSDILDPQWGVDMPK
ncbi:putative Zn(II)2Cys6 transcription factor-like protein [Phaeosphaeriaceae sp. PMI808]|nr:putative Zn(II)2Cys6 transcription factor-like protein [Phaeosphaeriaceae sp. PMI808]